MKNTLKFYPAYKDSGVPWLGELPEHWMVVPNRAAFKEIKEKGHPDEEMLSVTITHGVIKQTSLLADTSKKDSSNEDKSKYKLVCPGDIAYNKMRAWQGAVGASSYRGIISPAYIVVRPRESHNPRFFHYLFRTPSFMKEAERRSYGISSDQWSLRPEEFKQIYCSVPPLPEQNAIVRYLNYIDKRIRRFMNAKKKLIQLLAEKREAITHDALRLTSTHTLRLGAAADIIQRPINQINEQVYTPIGLFNRGRGIFHKAPITGADLGDSTFFWIEESDLVLSGQFAWEGAIALAGQEDNGCVASHRYPVLRGKSNLVESAYLLSFFKTKMGHLLLDYHSRGAAGRNRPLNVRTLSKEKIPIPPFSMQQSITEIVHLENRLYRTVTEAVNLLREYRTRLIADVVTGKLDVREAATNLTEEAEGEPVEEAELLIENGEAMDNGEETFAGVSDDE